ncbi:hypothetical protein T11_11522 [Trichinella zimbabwensis]|uniref:Uncharacterized protein n=1 Tax=Trichinella zimbabwensis TaxID=268475 RepID=A0A0V1GJ27_9BILA|nr:hypothetical protein T11_11522 [Trichinella zimbabwensis]
MEEEEVEGRWSRTTWPGEATSSKGSHSWGIEQRVKLWSGHWWFAIPPWI